MEFIKMPVVPHAELFTNLVPWLKSVLTAAVTGENGS